MNYEPNATQWKQGDIVIHDADAKEARMLMIVIGYTRDGLCKTKYLERTLPRKVYTNPITELHDPKRFPKIGYWNGSPVLASQPTCCPFCGQRDIDTALCPDESVMDEELAKSLGYDPDKEFVRLTHEHPELDYIVEEMQCDECMCNIGYGQRWYYNPETNGYDLPRPETKGEQS